MLIPDVFSSDVYTASQAKEARSILMEQLFHVRPVKIQAETKVLLVVSVEVLGGIAGNAIGGGRGQAIATVMER